MSTSNVAALARLVGWSGEGDLDCPWLAIEESTGIWLPEDYKEFIRTFPDGDFQTFINVLRPTPGGKPDDYVSKLTEALLPVWRRVAENPDFRYRLYPAPGGITPWGRIGWDWVLCWDTTKPLPIEWGTLIVSTSLDEWEATSESMSELLYSLISGSRTYRSLSYIMNECPDPRFDVII